MTGRRVVIAGGIVSERIKPAARVEVAGSVVSEHCISDGRVVAVVLLESAAHAVLACVGSQRIDERLHRWPCCRLPVVLLRERVNTVGRVVVAGGVVTTVRTRPVAVLELPVVLSKERTLHWPCCCCRWCC